jgi:hypothetical protein
MALTPGSQLEAELLDLGTMTRFGILSVSPGKHVTPGGAINQGVRVIQYGHLLY